MSDTGREPRKFLVVVDETPECEQALLYAARRAERTGASVVALVVVAPSEFQHWLGVEARMREGAEDEANELLDRALNRLTKYTDKEPERRVIIADRTDGIRQLIAEDPSIAVLVLAAAGGPDGPGPLVSAIAGGQAGRYPVPITLVPGGLTLEEIDAIT